MQLAWATDIHLNFVSRREAAAFCQTIEASGADAVLIGGDIAEAHDVEDWLRFLEQQLERPIYFVLGNHDYYGGSIARVRERIAARAEASRWLCWLDTADVVQLTESTGLVGHGGWADGRRGDYANSRVLLNDYLLIAELSGLDRETRRSKLMALGDEAAAHVRRALPSALDRFSHVVLLTHVPPFREACWHEGRISTDDFLPHFTCQAVGDVLLEIMRPRPDRTLTVLCGHTHGEGEARPLPNLCVRTGGAVYGRPALQPLVEVS